MARRGGHWIPTPPPRYDGTMSTDLAAMDDDDLENGTIKLEALIYRREHRLFQSIVDYCCVRKRFGRSDPRRRAIHAAFLYNLITKGALVLFLGGGGLGLIHWLNLVTQIAQTSLIETQTFLMDEQNRLIESSNALAEANRRSAIMADFYTVVEKVAATQAAGQDHPDSPVRSQLHRRLKALSRTMRPYYDPPDLSFGESAVYSPERAELLLILKAYSVSVPGNVMQECDFSWALFRREDVLVGADLGGANLSHAVLRGCDLLDANLRDTRLIDADLSGASIGEAPEELLAGLILEGAVLDRTDLRGSDLTGVLGLTVEQLERALINERTELPAVFFEEAELELDGGRTVSIRAEQILSSEDRVRVREWLLDRLRP